eukprot:m.261607 g.261607  ORF g.261607 m.261607 type:complete len:220 (+) comp15580_c0_seq2:1937-2596(+)
MGLLCDSCIDGTFNLLGSNPNGCEDCLCNTLGTVNNATTCHATTGACSCDRERGYKGLKCTQCLTGYFFANDECLACDEQCGAAGCVSGGPSKLSGCIDCAFAEWNGICVQECPINTVLVGSVCVACDEQCQNGCTGTGATVEDCNSCRFFETDVECVRSCPPGTTANGTRFCVSCNDECGSAGITQAHKTNIYTHTCSAPITLTIRFCRTNQCVGLLS